MKKLIITVVALFCITVGNSQTLGEEFPSLNSSLRIMWSKSVKHPVKGEMGVIDKFPISDKFPYSMEKENGLHYYGNDIFGTLYTNDGMEITGFFDSLNLELGNGGVFFMNNTKTSKCFWVTILNQKIISMSPTTLDQKPDLESITAQTKAIKYKWKINRLNSVDKTNAGINKLYHKYKMTYYSDVVEVNSHPESVINGYGIQITPISNPFYNDGVFVKCGVFKDGKLNGQGFIAKLRYSFTYPWEKYSKKSVFLSRIKWDIQAGIFLNDEFKEGREFVTTDYHWINSKDDIFTNLRIPNFEYMSFDNRPLIDFGIPVTISWIEENKIIFSEELGRELTVKSVNKELGLVTVWTDKVGLTHTFDVEKDRLFYRRKTTNRKEMICPKTVSKPVYRDYKDVLFTYADGGSSNSYTVKGLYYDKKITNTTTTYKEFAVTKSVIDHYESVTCPVCKGTGEMIMKENSYNWERIRMKNMDYKPESN
jgi:hypothetical protein